MSRDTERFFLDRDQDGHWFVIPTQSADEWSAWVAIDGDDERAWTPPDFAKPVGGSYTLVTFLDPRIEE